MVRARKILTVNEIVELNRHLIRASGVGFFVEPDNLINRNSLEYIREALNGSLFSYELYPTMTTKAAALGWQIISAHVFRDGNKRTGLASCELFLKQNGFNLILPTEDTEVIDIALRIASDDNRLPLDGFAAWLEPKVVPAPARINGI